MPKKVLVTGCSGSLGGALVRALAVHPLVKGVVGTDLRPPSYEGLARFRYYPADIRDAVYVRNLLEEEEIELVYHLAFLSGEGAGPADVEAVNIGGPVALIESAEKARRVDKLILASSVYAYGARPGNPSFITEDAPLREGSFAPAVWRRRMEERLGRLLPDLRPSLQVSTVRFCALAEGGGELSPLEPFFRLPVRLSALSRDCAVQCLVTAEAVAALVRVLEVAEFRGAFNLVPDDATTLKTLWRRLGGGRIAVPTPFLGPAASLAARLQGAPRPPEGSAAFLAHPVVADNTKLKRALGASFPTRSEAAFLAAGYGRMDRPDGGQPQGVPR